MLLTAFLLYCTRLQPHANACTHSLVCLTVLPSMVETTALGAAIAAAIGSKSMTMEDVKKRFTSTKNIDPVATEEEREKLYSNWKKAVERSLNWVE